MDNFKEILNLCNDWTSLLWDLEDGVNEGLGCTKLDKELFSKCMTLTFEHFFINNNFENGYSKWDLILYGKVCRFASLRIPAYDEDEIIASAAVHTVGLFSEGITKETMFSIEGYCVTDELYFNGEMKKITYDFSENNLADIIELVELGF